MGPARDILLRGHLWLLSLLVLPLIKWLPLKHVLQLLTVPNWLHPYHTISAERITALVERRLSRPRMMVHRPCLRQGLVLFHLLQLSGLPARLHFGLYPSTRPKERLHGHCWVTVKDSYAGIPPAPSLAVVWTHPGKEVVESQMEGKPANCA